MVSIAVCVFVPCKFSIYSHILHLNACRRAIEALGFFPTEPTGSEPFPACAGFHTAQEAFSYLYRALYSRGLLRRAFDVIPEAPSPPSDVASAHSSVNMMPEDVAFQEHLDANEVNSQL